MQKMTTNQEARCHLLELKQNNQEQWQVGISARRRLLHLRKKTRDDDEPLGLSFFFLQPKKNQHQGFFSWVVEDDNKLKGLSSSSRFLCFFFLNCRRWQWVGRLIIVFCNARKKKKRQGWGTFVVVFCLGFIRKVEDDNKCCIQHHLML